jgi:hypothetical protein
MFTNVPNASLPASRRSILKDALHADRKHPLRRVLLEIALPLLPFAALSVVCAIILLTGTGS